MSREDSYTDGSSEGDIVEEDEDLQQYDDLQNSGDNGATTDVSPSVTDLLAAGHATGVQRYEPVTDPDSDDYSEDWDDGRDGDTPRQMRQDLHANAVAAFRRSVFNEETGTVGFTFQRRVPTPRNQQQRPSLLQLPAGDYQQQAPQAQPQPQQQQQQQTAPGAAGAGAGTNAGAAGGGEDDDDGRTMDGGEGNYDEEYEPTEAEMLDYCEWLGVDPVADRPLMWIVREALRAPLPESWRLCYTEDRELYYFNMQTGESIWDHPMDAFYKALYKQEKAKLTKKRQCMRQYTGSFEIKPLQAFFSELADEEAVSDEDEPVGTARPGTIRMTKQAPWAKIPDALIDAIDFRLYVDPIVLPTSGRTVSRHTIVNNRWRDPFSREYIENRRLVPNVDKRAEIDAWLGRAIAFFFDSLETSAAGVRRAVSILPYLLDKEEEMSLRGQQRFFEFVKRPGVAQPAAAASKPGAPTEKGLTTSTKDSNNKAHGGTVNSKLNQSLDGRGKSAKNALHPSEKKNGRTGTNDSSNAVTPTIPTVVKCGPSVLELLAELDHSQLHIVFTSLLTMSTSTSRECLLYILNSMPHLALHSAFRGFSDEVLHMLHVSTADLAQHAQSIATAVARQIDQLQGDGSAYKPPAQLEANWTTHPWANAADVSPSTPRMPGSNGIGLAATSTTTSSEAAPAAFSDTMPTVPKSSSGASALAAVLAVPTAAVNLDFKTTNSEVIAALSWAASLVGKLDVAVNPLHKLDFIALLHVVFAMECTPDVKATGNCLARTLRGGSGWPERLCSTPEDVLVRLFQIAARDESTASRLQMFFDVAWFGGERALDYFRSESVLSMVTRSLLEIGATIARDKADLADQSADHLGAILVYHSIMSMDTFAQQPLLALRVAYNLLPRLTRSQWKPKHFDATVTRIIDLIVTHPVIAWRAMKTSGSLFLIRELCKKKRNADDSRAKLAQLEAAERRLEQSNAINNWGLLASRLLRRSWEGVQATISARGEKLSVNAKATPVAPTGPNSGRGGVSHVKLPSVPGAAPRPSPRGTISSSSTTAPTSSANQQKLAGDRATALQRAAAAVSQYTTTSETFTTKRDELHAERATGIVQCLQTLLAMRLKPKMATRADGSRNLTSMKLPTGSTNGVDDYGTGDPTPVPPSGSLSHRRVSASAAVPVAAQSRRDQFVASSCPALPPINLGGSSGGF